MCNQIFRDHYIFCFLREIHKTYHWIRETRHQTNLSNKDLLEHLSYYIKSVTLNFIKHIHTYKKLRGERKKDREPRLFIIFTFAIKNAESVFPVCKERQKLFRRSPMCMMDRRPKTLTYMRYLVPFFMIFFFSALLLNKISLRLWLLFNHLGNRASNRLDNWASMRFPWFIRLDIKI